MEVRESEARKTRARRSHQSRWTARLRPSVWLRRAVLAAASVLVAFYGVDVSACVRRDA
jgi:hypothetical protein